MAVLINVGALLAQRVWIYARMGRVLLNLARTGRVLLRTPYQSAVLSSSEFTLCDNFARAEDIDRLFRHGVPGL
jgi:hypothetical protein